MESRAEHARDFNRLVSSIAEGYIEVDLKDHDGNQVYDSNHKIVRIKRAVVNTDKSLSILGRAADAKKVGEILGAIDSQLRALDQLLHTNYSTTSDLRDVRNIAKANADVNNRQDGQINGLFSKTSEIESGVINNYRVVRILGHDGHNLATHTSNTIVARAEYVKTDKTLTDYNATASAGKVGEAIKQSFLILNASISRLVVDYNNLQSNQVIVDLTNQVLALKDKNDIATQTIQELKKSVEISSAESQSDNLDALHEPGRYYLGNAKGYSDAVLEVARLGYTNKIMQYIYSARNDPNRTERRIGTRNNGNSYSWSEWQSEY